MPYDAFRILFTRADFELARGPIDLELLKTHLIALPLESPILDIRAAANEGVSVEWASLISERDRQLVGNAVREFEQGPTVRHLIHETMSNVSASSSAPVSSGQFTSPPLVAGRYLVQWRTNLCLSNLASATFARATANVNNAELQSTHWHDTHPHAFNGAVPLEVSEGGVIRAALIIAKVGVGAVAAELIDTHWYLIPIE